jgi:hypothetical protein
MNPQDRYGYFEIRGTHLYTVLHEVPDPLARVLLIGAFGSERNTAYTPWVAWARYLAVRGIECLRFDYRGMGESTGNFGDMSFDDWSEDVELMAEWLNDRSPGVPLVLHGLELGALLASKAFAARVGDALLAWAPPASANEVLRPALQRRVTADNMFRYGAERRPMADYIRQLETGPLEVDGYRWSSKLWNDSFRFEMPAALRVGAGEWDGKRQFRAVNLDRSAEPLVKGALSVVVNPDLNGLFTDNFEWITSALAIAQGGRSGRSY